MYLEKPNNRGLKVTAGVIVILAVVLLSIAASVSANNKRQAALTASQPVAVKSTPASAPAPAATPAPAAAAPANTSGYKDGTFTATNQYYVPHGYETIKVSLTIKSGVITDSSIVNSENNRTSQIYQQDFASLYKSYVIGKNISGLNLSYVAGASDTTNGFDSALNDIQNQAKA